MSYPIRPQPRSKYPHFRKLRPRRCSYCTATSILSAKSKGKLLNFCKDCALVIITEAVKCWGHRVRDMLG